MSAPFPQLLQPEDEYYFSGKELIPHFPYKLLTENPSSCPNFQSGQEFNAPLPLSFFKLFKELPSEIREEIYICLLYSEVSRHVCESRKCLFKENEPRELHEDLAFETHYSLKSGANGGTLRIVNKDDLADELNVTSPCCKNDNCLGLLRHIDSKWPAPCYLMNVFSGLLSLMRFEGSFLDKDDKWMSKDKERNLGITKELLQWFWSHLVLDLGEVWGTYRIEPQQEKTPIHYDIFSKLCREMDRYHLIEKLHLEIHHSNLNYFKRRFTTTCKVVKASLPNVQSLTLWLYILGTLMDQVMADPRVMKWLDAFREIVVWKTFDLQLRIGQGAHKELQYPLRWSYYLKDPGFDDTDDEVRPLTTEILQKIQDIHQDTLRHIFMPRSLTDDNTDDFPSDFDLEGLFTKEKQAPSMIHEQRARLGRRYFNEAPDSLPDS